MTGGARSWIAVGIALAAAALAACQLLVGIEDETAAPVANTGAEPTADAGLDADPPATCPSALPPGPPNVDDDGLPSLPPITFAIRTFGLAPRGVAYGFDLDGLCTGLGDSGTSEPRCASTQGTDDPGGLDNALGKLLQPLIPEDAAPGEDPFVARLNSDIGLGILTVLLELYAYNGTENDTNVAVGLAPSAGLSGRIADAGPQVQPQPHWDGSDRWTYSALLAPSATTFLYTYPGYVVDSMLVVPVPATGLEFPFLGSVLPFRRGVFTATLQRREGAAGWVLTGGMTGASSEPAALYATLRHIDVTTLGGGYKPLCDSYEPLNDCPLYKFFREAADVPSGNASDASAPCAELSLGISFEAEQAVRAETAEIPPPTPCSTEFDAAACP